MSWHYRVLRHPDGSLALHEVYCDGEGRLTSCTLRPVAFVADADEGSGGITTALERALRDARERPVLDYLQFTSEQRHGEAHTLELAELQRLIDEGRASGVSSRSTDEILQEARTRAGVRPEQDS